jgi:ring-1,2-phenylacetyl-CoA epoxidase subunit PaaC
MMPFDNAYEAISEDNDPRWAFGTGFADPLAGVDPAVPNGVDRGDLVDYCLMLGDDALVMSHRLQQWCTNAPTLEDEVALANIALDLLGQARLLLSRAGQVEGCGRDEDALAFFRAAGEFRNVHLVELDDGDFAECVVRLLLFATWRLALLARLTSSLDPLVAAIAGKGVNEVRYHRDYAAQWAVRLGDGTARSRVRMQGAIAALWPYTAELFVPSAVERRLAAVGAAVDPSIVREEFDDVIGTVLRAATLSSPATARSPERAGHAGRAGRDGRHTPAFDGLLAELQCIARADPEAVW